MINLLNNIGDINFGNSKALKLAVKLNRPNYITAILNKGGNMNVASKDNKNSKKITLLQYALKEKAGMPVLKTLLEHPHQFQIDYLKSTELLDAIKYGSGNAGNDVPTAHNVLKALFTQPNQEKTKLKYKFYDPENAALLAALDAGPEVAEIIINNVNRDYISMNNVKSYAEIHMKFLANHQKNPKKYEELLTILIQKLRFNPVLPVGGVYNTHTWLFSYLKNSALLEVVLQNGGAIAINGRHSGTGNTLLHEAVKMYKANDSNAKEILRILKTHGARPNIDLKDKLYPQQILQSERQREFIQKWNAGFV